MNLEKCLHYSSLFVIATIIAFDTAQPAKAAQVDAGCATTDRATSSPPRRRSSILTGVANVFGKYLPGKAKEIAGDAQTVMSGGGNSDNVSGTFQECSQPAPVNREATLARSEYTSNTGTASQKSATSLTRAKLSRTQYNLIHCDAVFNTIGLVLQSGASAPTAAPIMGLFNNLSKSNEKLWREAINMNAADKNNPNLFYAKRDSYMEQYFNSNKENYSVMRKDYDICISSGIFPGDFHQNSRPEDYYR